MYKDIFFKCETLRAHLMHAMITAFADSEKINYYSKFPFRHAAIMVLDYIFQDQHYREQFIGLGKSKN